MTTKRILILLAILWGLGGCAEKPVQDPAYVFEPPATTPDYLEEVQPVLVKRCVVCHSCYNSPCQLKLSSWEGLERGASKERVYNGARLRSIEPSRLFVDAHSEEEWRSKGFSSVRPDEDTAYQDSVMYLLMDHKRLSPETSGSYFSEASDLTCAGDGSQARKYLKKHPNNGMPFGFPPLKRDEFNTVVGWLVAGAPGPSLEKQRELRAIAKEDQEMVEAWEEFLNRDDPKHQMTARYLFEHLFLAHLQINRDSKNFYEMVRSKTGPKEEIDLIATVRPYDDPETDRVYYRLRKIHSTIVHKTHMVYPFGKEKLARVKELFLGPQWLKEPQRIGYDSEISANPFVVFAAIPPKSRYQWLLDEIHYVIMTFIRGPVCKGQIALNVINDHFWLMFMDPDYDLSVRYPGFLEFYSELLRMPGEKGSDYRLFRILMDNRHYRHAVDFYKHRQQFYAVHYPEGMAAEMVWKGDRPEDSPMLTVYRHFDSASVHRGVLGALPRTAWVVDYPLLERVYYALVAGFDVYGNAGHQLATRLYMDALRIEGESYFLEFLPEDIRQSTFSSWYKGIRPDRLWYYETGVPAGKNFISEEPMREFIEDMVKNQLAVEGIDFDHNYLPDGLYPTMPDIFETEEDFLQGFVAASAPGVSFFTHVSSHNANVAWVRIKNIPGMEDQIVSAVINRWHDNVKFLFKEQMYLDPQRDRADFISGFVGSYPNYFFDVDLQDLPDLLRLLDTYDASKEAEEALAKYGVNRADDRFWEVYDWFQDAFNRAEPTAAGLLDLNRYYHAAINEPQ